jgi:hypothetical protein
VRNLFFDFWSNHRSHANSIPVFELDFTQNGLPIILQDFTSIDNCQEELRLAI